MKKYMVYVETQTGGLNPVKWTKPSEDLESARDAARNAAHEYPGTKFWVMSFDTKHGYQAGSGRFIERHLVAPPNVQEIEREQEHDSDEHSERI